MKQLKTIFKNGANPFGIAAAAILAVRVLGLFRVLLLLAGGAAGYFIGVNKVKAEWDILT